MVNVGMTVSVVLFLAGYALRKRVGLHRLLMSGGVLANLVSAGILLAAVYIASDGDHRTAGFLPAAPPWAILAHRAAALVAFVLMLLMAVTGILRRRGMHIALHRFFLPLYLAVYISGLLFFREGPV